MSENERDNKAAYAYYHRDRINNKNEPLSYNDWCSKVYPGQVADMVEFNCVIYED